jgi:hypothetical protein
VSGAPALWHRIVSFAKLGSAADAAAKPTSIIALTATKLAPFIQIPLEDPS